MVILARVLALICAITVASSSPSFAAALPDTISAEELLQLTVQAQGSAKLASSDYPSELTVDNIDDLSHGAICSDYAHLLQQALVKRGVFSELIAVGLDANAAAGNSAAAPAHNHVFLAVGPYVADPTIGIVYKHSFAEMLANPTLSEDYIGEEPSERLKQLLGRRFFGAINRATYDGAVFRPSQQKTAKLMLRTGAVKHGDIALIQDMDITTRGKFAPLKGTLEFEYLFDNPIQANAFTVIPGWKSQPKFDFVHLEGFYKGQKTFDQTLAGHEYRRAGYLFLLPYDEPRDRFVVTIKGIKDKKIYLRELAVTGKPFKAPPPTAP